MIEVPPLEGLPVGRWSTSAPGVPTRRTRRAGIRGEQGVAPGFIATGMAAQLLARPEGTAIRAQSPFNRVATPEVVSRAPVALAEPAAEWASGAVVDFNGAGYLR